MSHQVSPLEYSEEYFLTECDGYTQYTQILEARLAPRLRTVWQFARLAPGMNVLDIGCGRGEIVALCGMNGISATGLDFSPSALRLAQHIIAQIEQQGPPEHWQRPHLTLADAKGIPFPDNTFERIIMSDIVEHLPSSELAMVLEEAHRVLTPGGQLLIHTMPNLWYYRYGYPFFRLIRWFQGVHLPKDPRQRFKFSHVHINEQSPLSIRKVLRGSKFSRWKVWLYDYRDYREFNRVMRLFMRMATHTPIVKVLFCDDIFARAYK